MIRHIAGALATTSSDSSATGNPARYAIMARATRCFALCCCDAMFSGIESTPCISLLRSLLFLDRCGLTPSSMSQGCDQGQRCTYGRYEKVCSFRRTHPRFAFVKGRLSIPGPSIAYPMDRTQNQKRSLGNALSILISCLLFGRETHASTTQSDPLLLPTRNGPCQEDGALRWEALFYRAQRPRP